MLFVGSNPDRTKRVRTGPPNPAEVDGRRSAPTPRGPCDNALRVAESRGLYARFPSGIDSKAETRARRGQPDTQGLRGGAVRRPRHVVENRRVVAPGVPDSAGGPAGTRENRRRGRATEHLGKNTAEDDFTRVG